MLTCQDICCMYVPGQLSRWNDVGNGNYWETAGREAYIYEEYCWFTEGSYLVYIGMTSTLYCRKARIMIISMYNMYIIGYSGFVLCCVVRFFFAWVRNRQYMRQSLSMRHVLRWPGKEAKELECCWQILGDGKRWRGEYRIHEGLPREGGREAKRGGGREKGREGGTSRSLQQGEKWDILLVQSCKEERLYYYYHYYYHHHHYYY